MKFSRYRSNDTHHTVFKFEISDEELMNNKLGDFDKLVLEEINKGGSIADILLGLEIIARGIESRHKMEARK